MKSITRAVHLSSVVQSEFYGATRILFVHKENKNNSLSLLVRIAPFWILPIECKQRTLFCICFNARMRILRLFTLWFELKYRILALRRMQKNVRCLLKHLYSLKSFFVWCYKLCSSIFGNYLPFFSSPLHLSSSVRLDEGRCTFSCFSRNIWLGSNSGSGWATQRHSQHCV